MKKLILILSIFLVTSISYGQEFNQWAFGVEGGIHSLNDESAITENTWFHVGADLRYNFNPKFGLGITAGYDDLDLIDFNSEYLNTKVLKVNLEGYLNVFVTLDVYSKNFTILAHGGPGVAFIDGEKGYYETTLQASAGLTGIYKLGKKWALKADYSIMANISQENTLDGSFDNSNFGVTSTLHTVSGGLIFYLGKKDREGNTKEHADWYVYPQKDLVTINNITNPVTEITKQVTIEKSCDCNIQPESEYVFFDHDKYDIRDTELNAIYKVFTLLDENSNYTLDIRGWASPTSSTDNYNQTLSENRSKELLRKFVAMGIDESRITLSSFGKDKERSEEVVHDIARRVELIVTKEQ